MLIGRASPDFPVERTRTTGRTRNPHPFTGLNHHSMVPDKTQER